MLQLKSTITILLNLLQSVSIYTSLDTHGTMANIYKFKNAKSANMEIHKI